MHASSSVLRSSVPLLVMIATFACAGSACTSTKTSVAQLWSAPITSSPMRKMIVMAARMDEASRRSLEDSVATELRNHGVEALVSYQLFPEKLPERDRAQAMVRSTGADGILTLEFSDVAQHVTYRPGGSETQFWDGYFASGYGYPGGYVFTDEIVNLETTLWDARKGDTVVWAAMTRTTNPSSGPNFVKSVSGKVVPSLAKEGFIPGG